MVDRRLVLAAGVAGALGLAGCGGAGGGVSSGGTVDLRFCWWGSSVAHQVTEAAIEQFNASQTAIRVNGEPGSFAGYFDKLATQVASRDAPDVIQMNLPYLREYADRGALLDLDTAGVDASEFAENTRDNGRTDEGLMGVSTGINAAQLTYNPAVLDEAGVEMPDDRTWTWEQFVELTAEISAKTPDGTYGMTTILGSGAPEAWMRQRGKELFDQDRLGFEVADLASLYEMSRRLMQTGSAPSAPVLVEDITKPFEQSLFAVGKAGFTVSWSNQGTLMDTVTRQDCPMVRLPTTTGTTTDGRLWFRASSLFSGYAGTDHPEQVGTFINFLINDLEAGALLKGDRGMPPNPKVRAAIEPDLAPSELKSYRYLAAIEPEISTTPPIPSPGGGNFPTVITRHAQDVWFDRATPAVAARTAYDEVSAQLL